MSGYNQTEVQHTINDEMLNVITNDSILDNTAS